jgi:hypothetical protein
MVTKSKFLLSLIVTAFIGVLSSNELLAQNSTARAGIKGGFNVSNLYSDEINDQNARYGFNVGIYGQVLSSETFAIQPELLFTTKGTQAEYNGVLGYQEARFNLNYLELPLLAVFKLGNSAEIHAGGYAAYLLSANVKYSGNFSNGTDQLDRDNFKHGDAGLVAGFGLNFGAAQVGARYNFGLVELANSNSSRNMLGNSKNSCATLYLAFNVNSK